MRNTRIWLYPLLLVSLILPGTIFAQDEGSEGNPIYLPLVLKQQVPGGTLPSISPFGDDSVPDPYAPYTAPVPVCTIEQMESFSNAPLSTAAPDYNAPSLCQLLVKEKYSLVGDGEVQASNIGWSRKFAINFLNCLSACGTSTGVAEIQGVISAKEPSIPSTKSWNDYFYANFLQVSDQSSSITCQSGGGGSFAPTIYLGIGKGQTSNNPSVDLTSPTIYWEIVNSNDCYGFTTSNLIAPNAAILSNIYKDANGAGGTYWTGRVALAGQWVTAFSHEFLPIVNAADTIAAGQTIRAKNGDHSTMTVPLNFMHKLTLRKNDTNPLESWTDFSLPSPLNNKTTAIADAPFGVMDLVPNDFTSISSQRQ